MKNQLGDKIIVDLAELLNSKEVESVVVKDALALMCRSFGFDYSAVYEIDQYNYYNIAEQWTASETITLPKRVAEESLSADLQMAMAEEIIVHIEQKDENAPYELEIMNLFSVTSLVALSIMDEKKRICGAVFFLNKSHVSGFDEDVLRLLSISMSMLGRYVGIRMHQNKLFFAQQSLEEILDNTGIDIYVNDFHNHDILYVNKSMAAPYGGVEKFLGNKCWEVLFPGQGGPCEFCPEKQLLDDDGNPTKVYTWDYQRAFDGSWFRVFSAAFRWVDGRIAHVVSSADITDNKENEAIIEYMANYDSLTDLPNRRMLLKRCEQLISGDDEKGYILFFDIDGFKAINDNFGHDAGDEFLVQLGKLFSGIPMLKDSIYRNGGDEFIAVLSGEITKSNISSLARFIHMRFQKPWKLTKGEIFCNTSIGVACYPEDGSSAEALIQKADAAMYRAKKQGGATICFGYELDQ